MNVDRMADALSGIPRPTRERVQAAMGTAVSAAANQIPVTRDGFFRMAEALRILWAEGRHLEVEVLNNRATLHAMARNCRPTRRRGY